LLRGGTGAYGEAAQVNARGKRNPGAAGAPGGGASAVPAAAAIHGAVAGSSRQARRSHLQAAAVTAAGLQRRNAVWYSSK